MNQIMKKIGKNNLVFPCISNQGISFLRDKASVIITIVLVSLLATNNTFSSPSFPDYPLTSGAGNAVPHNVMLILDDSGSMEWSFMPTSSLMNNHYEWIEPQRKGMGQISWLCYDGGGKNFITKQTAYGLWYWDAEGEGGAGTIACNNPSQYLEGTWDELKRFDNGMVRSYENNSIYYNPAKTYLPWRTQDPLPEDTAKAPERLPDATITKVSNHASNLTGELDLRNSPHAVFFVPNSSSYNWTRSDPKNYYKYRVGTSSSGNAVIQRCNAVDTVQCTENSSNWIEDTPTMLDKNRRPLFTHVQRTQSEELQNFANWFHYHSTRMKMAKAGASEAFGTLDSDIRIGYDAINSNSIIYPIPHNITGGLFKDSNRSDFYDKLQAQTASGNTPLRAALERTGEYYSTANPYKNSKGVEVSCRRNYAVLVTDGAWTQDSSSFASLNLVAHHYWSTDLRPIKDNVPPSGNDYADWQHMNTFGISVGMERKRGNVDTPDAEYSSYIWKNQIPKSDPRFEQYTRTRKPYACASVSAGDITKIEDLACAAGEGYGRYFMASDTEGFAKALVESLSDMKGKKSSSGVAVSSRSLDINTRAFRASFTPGRWSGDLMSTHLTGDPSGNRPDKSWALSNTFDSGKANASSFTSRTVLRGKGGGSSDAVAFDDSFASGSSASALARTSGSDSVSTEDNIKWLRGEELNKLRSRAYPIGDIVNSTPAYSSDTQTVYVGANDGMLHAVNSDEGKVLFSYIPGGVDMATLGTLSSPKYEHRFFVDGSIDVMPKAHHGTRTLLLAAMGRGGRGVFSLDVSNPKTMSSTQVLWDDTLPRSNSTDMPDMGYVLGGVHLRKANGPGRKSVALIPNGIDSPNGNAALIVRQINADGSAESRVVLNTGAGGNNGLMALALADVDHNGTVDLVYGGDLKGNVWRWDFREGIPDASVQPAKLFSGDASRPITGGLVVSGATGGKVFVGFGTGRYISLSDVPSPGNLGPTQRLYGIIDHGDDNPAMVLTDTNLIQRKLYIEDHKRAFEPYEALPVDSEGWYVNLPPPERVIYPPNIANSAMYITTAIPDVGSSLAGDDCDSATGGGYIYAINLFTGTSPDMKDPYFRGDGTTVPKMTVNGVEVPIGGIPNGSIPTGVELLVGKNGEIEVLYDAGDGSLKTEHGMVLPDIDPEKKGRLSWREILKF